METTQDRKHIAETLLSAGMEPEDFFPITGPEAELAVGAQLAAMIARPPRYLDVGFPDGLTPMPEPLGTVPNPSSPLPRADIVVITWTVAEANALASVFTPGYGRNNWYRYARRFAEDYRPDIRDTAPAAKVNRLGSYFPVSLGAHKLLVMKSELHLNQDGVRTGDGTATLPVKRFFEQIIKEVKPKLVLTVGTAGAVFVEHDLGDVVVTRAAKFRLSDEFKNETFNHATYKSTTWQVSKKHFNTARALMATFVDNLQEPAFCPPTKRFPFNQPPIKPQANTPDIKLDGDDMPEFHPILTTDFFEFGTSSNNLEAQGCAVEMGDAVLGLVANEMGATAPDWGVVRNLSDPQINAELPLEPLNMQTHWAVWYYEEYGYWTSVMGALATWAIIAGYDK